MNRYIYIIILSLLASEAEAQSVVADAPRLVVNISIDQLRSDYLETYMPLFGKDGFRRLIANGALYTSAEVPFVPVDRASATAALITGSSPFYNGITSETWISRKSLQPVSCTTEQSSLLTPRGDAPAPTNMLVSTIGDELKISTKNASKVYSVAAAADAAVLLAGHNADCALWVSSESGLWTTSTYYNKITPSWVVTFNRANTPSGKLKTMNSLFGGRSHYADYVKSPLVNSDITNMALMCVASEHLGYDQTPDLLNIQYTGAVTAIAGPKEVYQKLDDAIGRLVTTIEQRIGTGKVLFVVSSTGYYDEETIDYKPYMVPSGTVYINRTANLLNMYLSAIYGQARYVEAFYDNQIYIDHKLVERKKVRLNEVLEKAREMLILSDGISDAHTTFSLADTRDRHAQMLRSGSNTDVSGDIILDIAPGWKVLNEETHRQQPWKKYGAYTPIIIYGSGVKQKVVDIEVTIDRIAPTIANAIRIRAPNASKARALR